MMPPLIVAKSLYFNSSKRFSESTDKLKLEGHQSEIEWKPEKVSFLLIVDSVKEKVGEVLANALFLNFYHYSFNLQGQVVKKFFKAKTQGFMS